MVLRDIPTNLHEPTYVEGIEDACVAPPSRPLVSVGRASRYQSLRPAALSPEPLFLLGPMARQIAAIDEAILGYAPDRVWAVIADVGRYREWCAPPLQVETLEDAHGIGSRIRISNGRLTQWVATLTHLDPDRVVLKYEGAWNGEARWTVSPCQDGTRLVFRIDLDPGSLWLKVLARTRDPRRRHSQQMIKIFGQLRKRMQTIEGAAMEPAVGSRVQ
jgi:hypothetical protein